MAEVNSGYVLYTICTQWQPTLEEVVLQHCSCYSIMRGRGAWLDVPEDAAQVQIVGVDTTRAMVMALARDIRQAFKQDAVLVLETPCTCTTVEKDNADTV